MSKFLKKLLIYEILFIYNNVVGWYSALISIVMFI